MGLYHTTLDTNVESIEREGIRLNRNKVDREIKGITDLFNYVFNKTYEKYLPDRITEKELDRNKAIFLSAHPEEFRKTEHSTPMAGEKVDAKDAVYECNIEKDLPVFDSMLYENFVATLNSVVYNHFSKESIKDYVTKMNEDKTPASFSNLIKYFISGDFSVLGIKNGEKDFEKFRDDVLEFSEYAVKCYCEKAIMASHLQKMYRFYEKDGKIHWEIADEFSYEKGFPFLISVVEILCNEDIPADKIKRIK